MISVMRQLTVLISLMTLSVCACRDHSEDEASFTHTLVPPLIMSIPSDPTISTQCLSFDHRGNLWLTSGRLGSSELIRYTSEFTPETQRTPQWSRWPIDEHFAEGCAQIGQHLLILTWRARHVLTFDLETVSFERSAALSTEGWGLAASSQGVIYSDGSSELHWLKVSDLGAQPHLEVLQTTTVRDQGDPVYQLNELEWFDQYLLANLYPLDQIAVIRPDRGEVIARLDLSYLRGHEGDTARELNGVAYQSSSGLLLVTGKEWSKIHVLDSVWIKRQLSLIMRDHD